MKIVINSYLILLFTTILVTAWDVEKGITNPLNPITTDAVKFLKAAEAEKLDGPYYWNYGMERALSDVFNKDRFRVGMTLLTKQNIPNRLGGPYFRLPVNDFFEGLQTVPLFTANEKVKDLIAPRYYTKNRQSFVDPKNYREAVIFAIPNHFTFIKPHTERGYTLWPEPEHRFGEVIIDGQPWYKANNRYSVTEVIVYSYDIVKPRGAPNGNLAMVFGVDPKGVVRWFSIFTLIPEFANWHRNENLIRPEPQKNTPNTP